MSSSIGLELYHTGFKKKSLTQGPVPWMLSRMGWNLFGRAFDKIGVIGSGQIGPDIALYFAKALAPLGVRVVVNDVLPAALESGRAKIQRKIDKGVETGAFKPDQAKRMSDAILWTADKKELAGAGLVVEAATEALEIKRKIFADLAEHCPPEAIFASNSSHLEPEAIFEGARNPARALVNHFFFPAERNPLVEVVPGKPTSPAATEFCMRFYEAIGKVPIRVGSRYGYAIDPIFEGLFLASLLLADSGVHPKQIDAVARKVLGLGVGPFAAMNLTGGTPITRIGLKHYHEKIMPWFHVPKDLETRSEPWPAAGRDETVAVDDATFEKISRRLKGAYFGLVGEVLDSGLTTVGDLELGVETGLVMKAPFQMMNETGVGAALKLVAEYAAENPGFKVAHSLRRSDPWMIPCLQRRDEGEVAVLTIRRPRTLNALNQSVYEEIRRGFRAIKEDRRVRAAVLTGFGTKAFVSGADIGMLEAVKSPAEGEALSWSSQEVLIEIENLGKPVVCAMNGLALGGGSELAMACTARVALKGLPVCFGQPEPKLGIIPGAGATQRLPRLVGFEAAWEILRTGRTVSAEEAAQLGYLNNLAEGDLLAYAVDRARDLARGTTVALRPLKVPATPPAVDIGPLSKRVDEILRKAIVEGLARPLEEGLRFESKCFGEVCGTKDMRIGMENFRKTQLKQPAPFVHA